MSRSKRYRKYRKAVTKHTIQSATARGLHRLPNYVDIDHIVPRSYGFKYDIPAELIGSPDNLQAMKRNDNIQKGQRISEKAIHLLRKWGEDLPRLSDLADAEEAKIELWEMSRAA